MKVKVLTFGSLTEILDKEFPAEASDTDSLTASLTAKYAGLRGRKFLVAVNNIIVQENMILKEQDVVALMPPYSGG
ncbi:MoaD/ThiS family protein [Olivibacter sp. XZL3]|uniref:MoaD/ThiS family protein n=1 Tax=Olivibacter sp. XZL3 TaxID=1735116 RepID=UPI001065DF4A|nr:MoaD/ThiS family protein [Olivibacter sp. XZL3]